MEESAQYSYKWNSCIKSVKMVSHNNLCLKLWILIESLDVGRETVVNIHKQLCFVYGWGAVYWSTASRWTQRIKASWCEETELHDLRRSGRPVTATGPDMLNCVAVVIYRSRRITNQLLAQSAGEVLMKYSKLSGFQTGVQDEFLVIWQQITDFNRKQINFVLNC